MSLRASASSFLLLVLAACHAAPPPAPQPSPELVQMQAEFAQQTRLLTMLLNQRITGPLDAPPESPATNELVGRLATLNERLDELLLRMPAAPAGTAAEASATRREQRSAPAVRDMAGVETLMRALEVNNQQGNTALENIANVNVAGFKRRQVDITTTLHPTSGLQVPSVARITPVFTTGTLEITDRNLDLAIDGDGFFMVRMPDGTTGYTRDGGFLIDAGGRFVNSSGNVLLPELILPNDTLEIAIDPEGRVTCRTASKPEAPTRLGTITLARFVDPHGLRQAAANTMTRSPDAAPGICDQPGAIGMGTLKQGFIERSNVQIVDELVNLQIAQQQRAALRRALAAYDIYVR